MFEGRINYLKTIPSKEETVLYYPVNNYKLNYNHTLAFALKLCKENNKKLEIILEPNEYMNYNRWQIEEIKKVYNNFDFIPAFSNLKNYYAVVTDKPYMKGEFEKINEISKKYDSTIILVESNLVVPIEEISNKSEYGAYTIRRKVMSKVDYYADKEFYYEDYKGFKIESKPNLFLEEYFKEKSADYEIYGSAPDKNLESNLSAPLSLGLISPIEVYLIARKYSAFNFIEQLIVRRTLSYNFVYYNENYDSLKSLPNWAKETKETHKFDEREYIYTKEELENSLTHDVYWNASMRELKKFHKINGHMRMYWGKKIIEWTESFEIAHKYMLYFNSKYAIDGNSPNEHESIMWCFGLHDRAFKERSIFGKVRYMNQAGLKRKYKMEEYLKKYNGEIND